MYSAWIEFLESLLPNFIGLKWIKHKNYIETKIDDLQKQIKAEQIDEILRGWFINTKRLYKYISKTICELTFHDGLTYKQIYLNLI